MSPTDDTAAEGREIHVSDASAREQNRAGSGTANSLAGQAGHGDNLLFTSLADFVENFFTVLYRRGLGVPETRWCTRWWDHEEAVQRLYLLWERYEVLHRQPGGLATWVCSYLDAQLPILLGPTGPFARCKVSEFGETDHNPPPILPTVPAPDDDPVRYLPGTRNTGGHQ